MADASTEKDTKKDEATAEAASEETTEETKEEAAQEPAEETKETAEAPAEETADDSSDEGEEVEVPEQYKALVDQVENMSVLELHELVKLLEKKFGVSAQAVAAAAPADAGGGEEEQSTFNVELTAAGDQKIGVIKAVKSALGLGLKEAKDLVEGAPAMLKEGMNKEEAEALKGQVEEAGGQVTLK